MEASKSGEKCFDCSTVVGLVLVGSYWMCLEHKENRNEKNALVTFELILRITH